MFPPIKTTGCLCLWGQGDIALGVSLNVLFTSLFYLLVVLTGFALTKGHCVQLPFQGSEGKSIIKTLKIWLHFYRQELSKGSNGMIWGTGVGVSEFRSNQSKRVFHYP
jgi:hypothetical protein